MDKTKKYIRNFLLFAFLVWLTFYIILKDQDMGDDTVGAGISASFAAGSETKNIFINNKNTNYTSIYLLTH